MVLRTTLTPELIDEGLFREVLNRVQTFRKELDLEYTERIRLTLCGAPKLLEVVRPRIDQLCRETLAEQTALDASPVEGAQMRDVTIGEDVLTIGLTLTRPAPGLDA